MAQGIRTDEPVPPPPMSRPNAGLIGWAIFGIAVAAILTYGFIASRGPSLRLGSDEMVLEGTPGSIRTYGSLVTLMEGDKAGKVSLSVVPSGPGVIAVGSLSDLRGEIAIVRGQRWLSYPEAENRMKVESGASSGESAAFLALADVRAFQEQRFDAPVSFDRLATELEARASRGGLDTSRPFPLVIDGAFSEVELNVANGIALGSGPITRERLLATAVKSSLPQAEGSIVGFFAMRGGERVVHSGERMHLHVVLPAAQQVGHLDSARIERGAVLRLPATR